MKTQLKAAILAVVLLFTGCGSAPSTVVDTAEIPQDPPKHKTELYIKETVQPDEIFVTEDEAPEQEQSSEMDVSPEGKAELAESHADDIYEFVEKETDPVEETEEIEEDPHLDDISVEEEQAPDPVMTSSDNKTYYGACTITHYCSCSACCGQWAGGPTASGVMPQAGLTVASDLPFGTQIEIDGQRYVVQDRGVGGMWIDVYCGSHEEAMSRGMYTADVYIING